MMGKELDGLKFKELQNLENQLTEGILSVKNKKVPIQKSLAHNWLHIYFKCLRCFMSFNKLIQLMSKML